MSTVAQRSKASNSVATRLGRLAGIAAIMVGLAAGLGGARAEDDGLVSIASLVDGPDVPPTRAWLAFCDAHPQECRIDPAEPAVIPFSRSLWETLVRVNLDVNRRIKPVTDILHWGVSDRWDFPTDGQGDCEDIQIEKRRLLAAAGVPPRAMRVAMVINKEGEGHAVLLVRTDKGDYVLDNRVNTVMAWYRTGYVWVKREGEDGRQWVSLGGIRAPVETAARH